MHQKIVIANWKSHKTAVEVQEWLSAMKSVVGKTVIISPSYSLLPVVHHIVQSEALEYAIASQDISPFDEGKYTGAVNGRQIKEFADYVLIGHSERRKHFHETTDERIQKVALAKKYNLTPIYLVQSAEESIPSDVTIVIYEPVAAIGSGHPDTPEHAVEVGKALRDKNPQLTAVLYGGSVTPENVSKYTTVLDGVIVGEDSLNPTTFSQIIANA